MGTRAHQAARALSLALVAGCAGGRKSAEPSTPPAAPPSSAAADAPDGGVKGIPEGDDGAAIVAVEQAVNQLSREIHACWAKAAADDFRLDGRVVLAVLVGRGGKTESVKVVEDTADDPVLAACLVALWKDHVWPAESIAAGETVQLPLEFGSPEAQYVVSSGDVPKRPLGKDGPGAASTAQVILHEASTGNAAAALSVLEMAPGMVVPLHRHPASTELIYLLSGKGSMIDIGGSGAHALGAGEAARIPAGTAHGLENDGTAPIVAVQLYAPAGPEQRFLGKPPTGTEPVPDADKAKRRGPRPSYAATAHARARSIAGGKGKVVQLFGPTPYFVGALTGQAGMDLTARTDPNGSQFFYVLEGNAVLTVAGQDLPVAAGDAIQIPSGIERRLRAGEAGIKALWFRVAGRDAKWEP